MFGYNPAEREPISMKSGALLSTLLGAGCGRFWVQNATAGEPGKMFCQHTISPISCRLNFTKFGTKRRLVSRCKPSEQNFDNFTVRGRFKKNAKISQISNIL